MLYHFNMKTKIDLHGKRRDEAERIIDSLAYQGGSFEVVTGHGSGVMKQMIKELQKVYDYRILSIANNGASVVIDFN